MQDVNCHDREVVSALRRSLAERVGAERYDLWFASTCDFEIRGDRLAVLVPNAFLQDWLRTNFRVALEHAAREALGPCIAKPSDPARRQHHLPGNRSAREQHAHPGGRVRGARRPW